MIDFAEAPSVPKSPWQLFYGAMHRLRWHWYARRASRLPVPVVSVGNIHWGGSGKTPLVAAIARRLQDTDRVVSILSRGYGSRAKGVRIVSTGEGPLLGPVVAGDEPVLLAGELPGVSVVVGPNRAEAGRRALERLSPVPEIFLLDDGFSHLQLFRDVDVVVFPAEDPWAGGRLLPSGRLREPLTSLARADAVVLSEASQSEADLFAKALGRYGFSGPGFASMIRPRRPRLDHDSELPADSKVLLVAAIARPHRLVDSAKELGYRVSDFLTFPDHYPYPEPSLRRIEEKFHQSDARAVVTSSKDMVKLWGRLDIPLAELSIRAEPDSTFFDWLDRRLEQIGKAEKRQ
jgi:tetraacyldisaccharide 4'-kinase